MTVCVNDFPLVEAASPTKPMRQWTIIIVLTWEGKIPKAPRGTIKWQLLSKENLPNILVELKSQQLVESGSSP